MSDQMSFGRDARRGFNGEAIAPIESNRVKSSYQRPIEVVHSDRDGRKGRRRD